PYGLLELGGREEAPAVGLGAESRVGGKEAAIGVLLGEVQDDSHRFGQHEIAIDQHRQLARRVELQKPGTLVLAAGHIDTHGLESDAELLEYPANPRGAGRAEFVELQRGLLSRGGKTPPSSLVVVRGGPFSTRSVASF